MKKISVKFKRKKTSMKTYSWEGGFRRLGALEIIPRRQRKILQAMQALLPED